MQRCFDLFGHIMDVYRKPQMGELLSQRSTKSFHTHPIGLAHRLASRNVPNKDCALGINATVEEQPRVEVRSYQ